MTNAPINELKISVIGLGYVGLPLSLAFGKLYETCGFDVNSIRIQELNDNKDKTNEVTSDDIKSSSFIRFTDNFDVCAKSDIYIVTVPTPIDENNKPDLSFLESASRLVATKLEKDNIVIYESTTYPGCTEEFCVPILESHSNLKFNKDFFCGYSPERINPGDKQHRLENIAKIVSGSNSKTLSKIKEIYSSIINAEIFCATTIKVAEAAKVIENSQRDINIAFVNELSKIFDKLNINTSDVLAAASTKWNFLPFTPGLVGGHCIGVDPFYLTHKSQVAGYNPEVILAGRHLNDSMGPYIAKKVVKEILDAGKDLKSAKIGILGLSFKENCPDIRNSKVFDIINEFMDLGIQVHVYDDWIDWSSTEILNQAQLLRLDQISDLDAVILSTPHDSIITKLEKILSEKKYSKGMILFDVKSKIIIDRYEHSNLKILSL